MFDNLQHPNSMLEPVEPDFPRVVILRGAGGKAFSGGVDIKAADRGIGGEAWDYHDIRSQQLLSRLIEKFRAVPQPIIAAVEVRGCVCVGLPHAGALLLGADVFQG